MTTVKLLANNITLGTANNNINNARVVRIVNSAAGIATITQSDPVTNSVIGTIQILPGTEIMIDKRTGHFLSSDQSVQAVKCGYGN
jgi:hypothetical protein